MHQLYRLCGMTLWIIMLSVFIYLAVQDVIYGVEKCKYMLRGMTWPLAAFFIDEWLKKKYEG